MADIGIGAYADRPKKRSKATWDVHPRGKTRPATSWPGRNWAFPRESQRTAGDHRARAHRKIESERSLPRPDEVLIMAESIKHRRFATIFARGSAHRQQYVARRSATVSFDIVLKMLASLNAMDRKKERLIEIAADGTISKDEIDDFVRIQKELECISVTVETLQLWVEKMLANGRIDTEAYNKESEAP